MEAEEGDTLSSETSSESSRLYKSAHPSAPSTRGRSTGEAGPPSNSDTPSESVEHPQLPVGAGGTPGAPSSERECMGPITPEFQAQAIRELVSTDPLDDKTSGCVFQ